ncbi:MAG TPA: hypothetical protein PLD88_05310 [Candidatus Berkiella sp.]|nr:hypothetical protein [Candidatus Berkiella sp.]
MEVSVRITLENNTSHLIPTLHNITKAPLRGFCFYKTMVAIATKNDVLNYAKALNKKGINSL